MQNAIGKKFSLKKLLPILLLCGLGIAIYSNSLNGSFHFDDELSIVGNANIRNLSNPQLIWEFVPTRFITYFSFALNYHLGQLQVFGYHLLNLIIHLSVGILVWWFARLTFSTPLIKKDRLAGEANAIAFLTAAVFLAHPIQTQTVNYIVQRSVGLATLFYLLTLCLYIKSRLAEIEKNTDQNNFNLYYFASLIALLAGIFTKEIIITLPLAILLFEFCFIKTQAPLNWKKILPFLIIILILPLTLFLTSSDNSRKMVQILQNAPDIPRWNYLLTQPRVIITYLRLLFIPLNQNLDYDYPIANSFFEPQILSSFLALLAILVISIRLFRKHRLLSFALLLFFLTLLPESSFIPLADVIFEHRLYLPMLGFSIFLVVFIYNLNKKKNLAAAILVLIIAGYGGLTYWRNFAWQDDIILSRDMTQKAPLKSRSYVNLGNAYARDKIYDQAIANLIKATQLAPDNGEAYYNLGGVYYEKNDPDKAIFYLNKAIELNPLDFQAYYYRGMSWGDKQEYNQAIADFNQALDLNPKHLETYRALAHTYLLTKRNQEAISLYNKAIELNPNFAQIYIYAAEFCAETGQYQMAVDLCKIALKIDPRSSEAYNLISRAYYQLKDYPLAAKYSQKAIQLGYPVDHKFLELLNSVNKK